MRSLGLDVGDKRTGVAISDPEGLLAVPLTVIAYKSEDSTIDDIIKLVEQHQIGRIVVGLPRSLDGSLGPQADKVNAFTEKLRNAIAVSRSPEPKLRAKRVANSEGAAGQSHFSQIDIKLWDERFSTVAVAKLMAKAGGKRSRRKEHRDEMAAAFILQGFLDSLKEISY